MTTRIHAGWSSICKKKKKGRFDNANELIKSIAKAVAYRAKGTVALTDDGEVESLEPPWPG